MPFYFYLFIYSFFVDYNKILTCMQKNLAKKRKNVFNIT